MSGTEGPLAQYSFRRSVLEQERTYSVYPGWLVVEGPDLARQTLPLSDVRAVRLKYEHTKQREYYQCYLHLKDRKIVLRHVHWANFGAFQDRRETYTPFVKTLLAQLAAYPNVRFQAGSLVNFGCAILGVPLMAFLGYLALNHGSKTSAILAGIMLAICLLMIGPSRPQKLDPLAPPANLLP